MAGYNKKGARTAVASAVKSTGATAATHGGGTGYLRDEKSELFLAAVNGMAGEDLFYESGTSRDQRAAALVAKIAVEDGPWLLRFIPWLRNEANMRTMSLMLAAEGVRARLEASKRDEDVAIHTSFNEPGINRKLIDLACQRADEPGELLAYWTQRYGRSVPKAVKRGLGDAAERLYTEYSYAKYDSDGKGVRFSDILNLTHAKGDDDKPWQDQLFNYIIADRYGRGDEVPDRLVMLRARRELLAMPVEDRKKFIRTVEGPSQLSRAGITWEALAGWLQGPMDAKAWEAVIPSMGYMALLRNLRNFDQAGVSDKVADIVADKLADPNEVARSRQLPMRFLSAHRAAASSERWNNALRKALDYSLKNVPELKGRTLILVDTSGSMHDSFSKDGTLMRWDAATVFGLALARRCEGADVISFSNRALRFDLNPAESLLSAVQRWKANGMFQGGGTETMSAVRSTFNRHDRVVVLTDEQAFYDHASLATLIPKTTMVYTYNLAGYRVGHAPSGTGNMHTFGGLTDACFRQIPLLEAGSNAAWPF